MNVGSLFAGIGGFDLGLERAGMTIVWQVEIDDYCRKILAKHWPDVPKYGDIRECGAHNLEAVDLVCGGFPCQPFSQSGKRQGQADDRYLWPEMLRVISEIRPRWVIGENVSGLISLELDTVLSDLEGQGYSVGTLVIPACATDARHRRDRLWIIANAAGNGSDERRTEPERQQREAGATNGGDDVADAERMRRGEPTAHFNAAQRSLHPTEREEGSPGIRSGCEDCRAPSCEPGYCNLPVCDTISGGFSRESRRRSGSVFADGCRWSVEPRVGRVAHGIPHRVDRLKGLGNAIVPEIPEILGRMILEIEN